MSALLSSEVEKVISDFLPVLNRMSRQNSELLLGGILQMKPYGVEGFSTRVVYKSGFSSIFCTSVNWAKITQDQSFKLDFINHVSPELVKSFKEKTRLISRSGDRIDSPFLKKLQGAGVNNTIIMPEFFNDRIEIVYFMCNTESPEARDKILNNLECLNFIKKSIKTPLQEIINSQEFKNKKELLLTPSAVKSIWKTQDQFDNTTTLFLNGKYHNLSHREIECLTLLRFGSSNQFISDYLNISTETVKCYVTKLKQKLIICSRKELIDIAQDHELIKISKILELI